MVADLETGPLIWDRGELLDLAAASSEPLPASGARNATKASVGASECAPFCGRLAEWRTLATPAEDDADEADPRFQRAPHYAISESLASDGCHRSTSGKSFIRGESSAQRVAHGGDGLSARYASRSSR